MWLHWLLLVNVRAWVLLECTARLHWQEACRCRVYVFHGNTLTNLPACLYLLPSLYLSLSLQPLYVLSHTSSIPCLRRQWTGSTKSYNVRGAERENVCGIFSRLSFLREEYTNVSPHSPILLKKLYTHTLHKDCITSLMKYLWTLVTKQTIFWSTKRKVWILSRNPCDKSCWVFTHSYFCRTPGGLKIFGARVHSPIL